jgi:hypothetical protein
LVRDETSRRRALKFWLGHGHAGKWHGETGITAKSAIDNSASQYCWKISNESFGGIERI